MEKQEQRFELKLPFKGFFVSIDAFNIRSAYEILFADNSREKYHEKLAYSYASQDVAWDIIHREYAKKYAELYCAEIGLKSARFVMFDIQKWYNCGTDQNIVSINRDDLKRLYTETNKADLKRIAIDRHMSSDGFISYYNPDFKKWGRVEEWDINKVSTLLFARLESHVLKSEEVYLMNDQIEKGWLDNLICENFGEKSQKMLKLCKYLKNRAQKPGNTITADAFDACVS